MATDMERPDLPSPYPSGTADFYWRATEAGRLELLRCQACDRWVHYPRRACPHCRAIDPRPEEVAGTGVVYSFTVVQGEAAAIPSYFDRIPYAIVLVTLDEGPQLLANLLGGRPPRIGERVRLAFERRGGVTLPQFEPEPEP